MRYFNAIKNVLLRNITMKKIKRDCKVVYVRNKDVPQKNLS